jgi:osmotically-inducible protein OsmY
MKNATSRRHATLVSLFAVALTVGGVAGGTTPPPPLVEPADCDTAADDAAIATAIRQRLLMSASIEAADIDVFVRNGQVGLRGLARSRAQKTSAGERAGDTRGVRDVANQLDVVDWVPITEVARVQARSRAAERAGAAVQSDAWISTTIGQALRTSRGVGSCDIRVGTQDGAVTLQGEVGTHAARELAVTLAGDTLGVRSVEAARLTVR